MTAKDKISFSKLQLGKQITDQGFVSGIKVGFVLFNAALFPIEYSIQTIQTNLSGIYPQGKPHEKMAFTISANAFGWFYDHIIEFHNSEPLKGRHRRIVRCSIEIWSIQQSEPRVENQ